MSHPEGTFKHAMQAIMRENRQAQKAAMEVRADTPCILLMLGQALFQQHAWGRIPDVFWDMLPKQLLWHDYLSRKRNAWLIKQADHAGVDYQTYIQETTAQLDRSAFHARVHKIMTAPSSKKGRKSTKPAPPVSCYDVLLR